MSALEKQEGGSHYKDCAIQPIQYIEANKIAFLEGCVIKRCTRHDKPTGKGRQDIEKAIHELQLLLELRYPGVICDVSYRSADIEDTARVHTYSRKCLNCGRTHKQSQIDCDEDAR